MRLYDAHNHLQDERFGGRQAELVAACERAGVRQMVVNGSCEDDWPQVLALAKQHPIVLPSFGYHPWYVHERSADWLARLTECLDKTRGAVGEIGLDRWKRGLPYEGQEEVFVAQLHLAAERNLPASIHCLQAWGWLHDLLLENARPARGFVLHSYGGPRDMIEPLAKLGAYFSFPGYYLHERKARQRQVFKHAPTDRLLVETDAPDQLLPGHLNRHPLADAAGQPLNHPANLTAAYEGLAETLNLKCETLAERVEENFLRLFGKL